MRLLIGIPTLGKSILFSDVVDALLSQTERSFDVIVCHQGGAYEGIYEKKLNSLENYTKVAMSKTGISAAKNFILQNASSLATHVVFLNDTSRVPPDFVKKVYSALDTSDLVVASYMDQPGKARYRFSESQKLLSADGIWLAIEPATILPIREVAEVGGFDVSLGTGSLGRWQSGEGTDLLFRLVNQNLSVAWRPDIEVFGVEEAFNLNLKESLRKKFYYGCGYIFVIRRHDRSLVRYVKAILGPFSKTTAFASARAFMGAAASALGRASELFRFKN